MSQGSADIAAEESPFPGVSEAEWRALLERGRTAGSVHADQIAHVLRDVELTPEVFIIIHQRIADEGIVIETGLEESDGGRPRAILAMNPGYGYVIGVDIGETRTRVELFDLTMTERARAEFPGASLGGKDASARPGLSLPLRPRRSPIMGRRQAIRSARRSGFGSSSRTVEISHLVGRTTSREMAKEGL